MGWVVGGAGGWVVGAGREPKVGYSTNSDSKSSAVPSESDMN